MRAFVAIELSRAVRQELETLVNRLKKSGVRASWTSPDTMHLTLRFLGDITEDQAQVLAARLREQYAVLDPFELMIVGTGAFPTLKRPNIVWAGVIPLDGPLSAAQSIAENAAQGIGLTPEKRKFHPHLTLARLKDPKTGGLLFPYLAREKAYSGGRFQVNGVSLYQSRLSPKGAKHTRLESFPFGSS